MKEESEQQAFGSSRRTRKYVQWGGRIAGYDGSARVALFVDFRENVETTSLGIRVG